ncbi:hypothetical protein F9A33_05520, partial [Campylobacter jejuni]|nr:hypothetical protein [Campylobacter jejuni]
NQIFYIPCKYFTIKKFKKGLKLIKNKNLITHNFTIKKFKKGLKLQSVLKHFLKHFTIKKFKKGLKTLVD